MNRIRLYLEKRRLRRILEAHRERIEASVRAGEQELREGHYMTLDELT